jgi:SAM-dependent methyltransferase
MITRPDALSRFRIAYAAQRAAEGRGAVDARSLPYVREGPYADAWRVRARTWERFLALTVAARAAEIGGPLRVLDIGAGNCWLCYRLRDMGHHAVAVDLRDDAVDGLGAAGGFAAAAGASFHRIAGSFQDLPLRACTFDIAVFNASLHYATSLSDALAEAAAVLRPRGRIAILDSPFYRDEETGAAMVAEKHAHASEQFGERAADLLGLPFIEYLTRARLEQASTPLELEWTRHRVRYPVRYELRPFLATLRGARPPSRFDLWEATLQ